MKLELNLRGVSSFAALRTAVERRVAFALDRFEDRVARVRVTLDDVNGPKGGDDKRCQVDVKLRDGLRVRATALEADSRIAVDVAMHRAARSVVRAIDRLRKSALDHRWLERALPSGQT